MVNLQEDGRELAVPLVWFPKRLHTGDDDRNSRQLIENSTGIQRETLAKTLLWNAFYVTASPLCNISSTIHRK